MMHSASESDVTEIDNSRHATWFFQRLAASLEKYIGNIVEGLAAILVVAEVIILFAGVISRYAFHKPIVAADEISAILFLWLSMLGAVIAFRRRNHMRMMAVVNKVSKSRERILNAVATAAAIAFCVMLLTPALHYAMDEQIILTPALEIICNVACYRAADWCRSDGDTGHLPPPARGALRRHLHCGFTDVVCHAWLLSD